MSRIVNQFHKHGKSAFSLKNNGKEFTCAEKVIMERYGGRKGIGYILDGEQIIMETCSVVSMGDIELPKYNRDHGVWTIPCNDGIKGLYSVVQYDPIHIKIFDSGNYHMTMNRVVLSTNRTVIPYY